MPVSLSRQRLLHKITEEVSHLIERQAQVAARLPRERRTRKRPDVTLAARTGRYLQIERGTINAVVEAFAPHEVATRGELHGLSEREFDSGLKVHQVLRADERGLIEVGAARKQGVERAKI